MTSSDLSVQSIAQQFSVSPSYFSRLFNSAKQQSFPQYVNEMRLERGKELLENTSQDIKDIAEMVGNIYVSQDRAPTTLRGTQGSSRNTTSSCMEIICAGCCLPSE
ncbi:MAG: helix-turn-helix transcriptional regulator [Clostridia bacterium]|nr:helix-turn-helix transcriptional regulator [Clostridia bacterium]